MLVPLIAAVPLAAVSDPPMLAGRAPGSRELSNCRPFTATVAGETGAMWRLPVLLGTPLDVGDPSRWNAKPFPSVSDRRPLATCVLPERN